MSDLSKRLRDPEFFARTGRREDLIEAADEIDRLRAKLASVVEECAGIAESHTGAGRNPNYDEACRDIAEAIRAEFAQSDETGK